jgi:xanthine dehydrogenase accessory factor
MKEMYDILTALERSGGRSVLATVIRVEGSAYRKPGASMLLLEDGSQVGLLTGGCLEADIVGRISEWLEQPEAFEEADSRTIRYDMRAEDDLSWGQGAGCNGIVHVLLEPVTSKLRSNLLRLYRLLKDGVSATVIRELSPEGTVTDYWIVPEKGDVFGGRDGQTRMQLMEILLPIANAADCCRFLVPDGSAVFMFIQRVLPRPRLALIGAGPDARPLARLAAEVGFTVSVADWRESFCNELHFPGAVERIVAPPHELLDRLELTPRDFVVVMTHDFQKDKEYIQMLIKRKPLYLGVLGSARRTIRLCAQEQSPYFLHSPVGLRIGAEGPEEIAVSVVAEMISIYRLTPCGKGEG